MVGGPPTRRVEGRNSASPHFGDSKRAVYANRRYFRATSHVSDFLAFLSGLCLVSFTLSKVIDSLLAENSIQQILSDLLAFCPFAVAVHSNSLQLALVLAIMAIASETFSRLRIPPPVWRIRQDLMGALTSSGITTSDLGSWIHGTVWISPIGRYNRKTRSYTILFNVRSIYASPEMFSMIEKSPAAFSHAQEVSIEPVHIRFLGGRRECFKLTLWYSPSSFGSLSKNKPW